jgi:glycosyltransferase involved in cell wall biosynthesis
MARVVAEVLADATARAEMGRAAASWVRQRHDGEAIVARLIEHYREAIRQCESP